MRLGVGLFAALGLLMQVGEGQSSRVFTHDRDVETGYTWLPFPRWDGATLVGCVNNSTRGPVIYAIDREGRRDETIFTLQDGGQTTIWDVAASRNGEIAIAGSSAFPDNKGSSFLARISADRKRQTITRVWPHCPEAVTFASDGNVWTIGHLKNFEGTTDVAYHVMRRYDPSGTMIGSATVPSKGGSGDRYSFLRSSRDRVGWFTRAGEYIEFLLNGSELARYAGPDGVDVPYGSKYWEASMAMSERNDVILSVVANGKPEFVALDKESRSWTPITLQKESPDSGARVLGFDGPTLVTTPMTGRMSRYSPR